MGRRVARSWPPSIPGWRPGLQCVCAVVCVSLMQTLPPQTDPPTVCHSIQIWKRLKKNNSMTHNGDGARGGQWHWGPKSRVTDCKNLGRGRGGVAPTSPKCTDPRWGGAARGREGSPGAGPGR